MIEHEGQTYETAEEMIAALEAKWGADPWWEKLRYRAIRYRHEINHLRRQPRYMWQRARRGYSEQDSWTFHPYLARVIVGGVTRLRERSLGHPSQLTAERWDEILDTIIAGFSLVETIESSLDVLTDEQQATFDEAVRLLGEYFLNLWD